MTVITAFSRSPSGGKTYVQHKIKENGEFLSDLIINHEAIIYVSGRAKLMPASVEKAFTEAVGKALGVKKLDEEDKRAIEFIANMKKQRRYQIEVW